MLASDLHRFVAMSSIGFAALCSCMTAEATAALTEFTWTLPEVIESDVESLGESGGRSAEFSFAGDGLWRLVYVKAGDIYSIAGNQAGWSTPVNLSNDPAASRVPSIATSGSHLHAVWEDERTGHAEVWTRRFDGTTWTDAECLSCDEVPSSAPALDAAPHSQSRYAVVAWQENPSEGPGAIRSRIFKQSVGSWGAIEDVSSAAAIASAPSVAIPSMWEGADAVVVWEDRRHGESEIYSRRRVATNGPWRAEARATNLPGNCTRPRVAADVCCFDYINTIPFVVFENDQGGVVESWARYGDASGTWSEAPFLVSTNDGIASRSPTVAGIKYLPEACSGFDRNISFISWVDVRPGPSDLQFGRHESVLETDDPLIVEPDTQFALAARTRSPNAPVLQAWSSEGSLSVRLGAEFNCYVAVSEVAPYFYVAPAGGANDVLITESCRNEPIPQYYLQVRFYNGMEGKIALDPAQPTYLADMTDQNGIANFPFRGGGCVTEERAGNGFIVVSCVGWGEFVDSWDRIKSPDIDGTCTVDPWDVQYVQDRLGTDDFCADLDGSGTVDEQDVTIVQAALGDACQRTAAVPDLIGDAEGMQIRVAPNPGSDRFQIAFTLATTSHATVSIVDVAGRVVRELGQTSGSRDGVASVTWNGRDDNDRLVPTGVYFAKVQGENGRTQGRATLIVAR